jgi:hypothetical protein
MTAAAAAAAAATPDKDDQTKMIFVIPALVIPAKKHLQHPLFGQLLPTAAIKLEHY